MNKTILIVERDNYAAGQLKQQLEMHGYTVRCTTSGKSAVQQVQKQPFSAIILEWDLQDMEGIDVCKQIRYNQTVPIIMISTRVEELDIVLALELGATDYIRKPFGFRELLTRLRIHLKRYEQESRNQQLLGDFAVGPFKVDYLTFKVYKNNEELPLTYSEFKLLIHLLSRPSEVLSREDLISMLELTNGDRRTVDVHIRRLREKIEERPSTPKWIKTKSGIGYYFNAKAQEVAKT